MTLLSLETQIRRAVRAASNAGPMTYIDSAAQAQPDFDPELRDDDVIEFTDSYERLPTCVYVDGTRGLLGFYATLQQMYPSLHVPRPEDLAEHEKQHLVAHIHADKKLKKEDGIVGASFHEEDNYQMGVYPFVVVPGLRVPKIGLAAITAYPEANGLSLGDLRMLARLGYDGVQDVTERVIAWNAALLKNGTPLPVPLTYRG